METKVQRWGNSLAVRIPKAYALQMGIEADSVVALRLDGTTLLTEPVREADLVPTMDEMLDRVTPENMQPEIDFGPPVGREVW